MKFGLENHPSTWRGAALLACAAFAFFDRPNAYQYFMAGMSISGLIGVGVQDRAP